jgi:cell division protein FtsB
MRLLTIVLGLLLALVQGELWLGSAGVFHVARLRGQVAEQQASNEAARQRNLRLAAEVEDLKAGLEMVEEKARAELGMLKPDEIYVQVSARRAP